MSCRRLVHLPTSSCPPRLSRSPMAALLVGYMPFRHAPSSRLALDDRSGAIWARTCESLYLVLGILGSKVHVVFANASGGWLGVGNDATYNHSRCFSADLHCEVCAAIPGIHMAHACKMQPGDGRLCWWNVLRVIQQRDRLRKILHDRYDSKNRGWGTAQKFLKLRAEQLP